MADTNIVSFEVKSQLAKLMATENITMQVDPKAITASFNTDTRLLILPLWQNISEDLYDMLVVHEVGHALDTPANKWISTIADICIKYHGSDKNNAMMAIKDYLNVVEDARIERRQKIRYPGSKRNFVVGYKELYDRDFFGIKGKNVNTLSFIDRANIYFKNGTHFDIQFSPEEKAIIRKMENTQSFDDVIKLTDEIYGLYATQQANQTTITIKTDFEEDSDSDDEFDSLDAGDINSDDLSDSDFDTDSSSDDSDNDDQQKNESAKSKSGNKEDKDGDGEKSQTDNREGGPSDNIVPNRSVTQQAAEQSAKDIVANSKINYVHVDIPHANLDNIVDDFTKVIPAMKADMYHYNNTDFEEWRSKESDTISYMVKEFEMRKAADTYARQRVAKTGVINTNKLHSYKYNDDIFRRNTIIPAGKNHGFVMFLDWSGSMCSTIKQALKQVFSLVLFCKRVNVPFEVYIFRTFIHGETYRNQFKMVPGKANLNFGSFRLRNILSSRMTMSQLTEAFHVLWGVARMNGNCTSDHMNGTPLNAAIVAADQIINNFRKKYKLQIVNTVFVTDGGSDATFLCDFTGRRMDYCNYTSMLVLRDPVTNKTYVQKELQGYPLTSTLLKVLKSRTNCNLIGFFITGRRGCAVNMVDRTELNSKKVHNSWKKYKFAGVKSAGYDEYFLINFQHDQRPVTLDVDPTMKKGAITKAFAQFTEKKSTNRMMIKTLMDHVATDSVVAE